MARNAAVTSNTAPRASLADREGSTGRGGRGMRAWKKAAKESGGGDFNDFKVEEGKKYVIAFPEDGPFEVVWVHWVPAVNEQGRTYNTPRNCPTSRDEDASCPLCDRGVEAKPVAYFNVTDLDEPGKVCLWKAAKDATNQVDKLFDELQSVPADRGGPLELNSPGVYAEVSKEKQKNGRFAYSIRRVKERDLGEDYDLAPMTDDDKAKAAGNLYDGSVVKYNSAEALQEIADALED